MANPMGRITRRFRIEGNVQGVNFRHSTREQAQCRGIAGYARNLPDGSVEVLAHGAVQAIEELLRWLQHGPRSARVDRVAELAVEAQPGIESEPRVEPEPAAGAQPMLEPETAFQVR